MVLEGTYPFVPGGVSSWTHELIQSQADLTFHLLALTPAGAEWTLRYELPKNVVGMTRVSLSELPEGSLSSRETRRVLSRLGPPLLRLGKGGGLAEIQMMLDAVAPYRGRLGSDALFNSRAAWDLLMSMYDEYLPNGPFNNFFWSWRACLTALFSVLLGELPKARVYHSASTGYAGLYASRASLETGRPSLVTEHGIYTNERRIEIAMADWLYEGPYAGLTVETFFRDLKGFLMQVFTAFSRATYEASSKTLTLFEGNQVLQKQDGADPGKMQIVPNGVDFERYSSIKRVPHSPTVALIGRVVPIKDVKTFIRACSRLRVLMSDLTALVMGPKEEDLRYYEECRQLVEHLGLRDTIRFTGKVKLEDYLGRIDALALTSISEAQPLVILEAGAAGIPTVATNVGACREMIHGGRSESPSIGPGGAITALASPDETAQALARLLSDPDWRRTCSLNIKRRVERHYNKTQMVRSYRDIYEEWRTAPAVRRPAIRERRWPE